MPNDFLTLHALSKELNKLLRGGKIEKIAQPEKDEIILTVRSLGSKYNLAVSCCAETPRINVITTRKENPMQAPAFCMHLRKLIGNGYIENIAMYNSDRIIDIAIVAKNELKDTLQYRLIFEMMGRYSNILIVGGSGIILDAIKQVSYDTATKRCILPGMPYSAPEQTKIKPFDYDAISARLREYTSGSVSKFLLTSLGGLAQVSADEIVYRADIADNKPLGEDKIAALIDAYKAIYGAFDNGLYSPIAIINHANNKLNDYYICPYNVLKPDEENSEIEKIECATLSEAIDKCIGEKINNERHREKTKALSNAIKKYRQRNIKKLQKSNEKLQECTKIDTVRIYGELINCNLHNIKRGMDSYSAVNYYSDDQELISIPLNPLLSPSENAQAHFKRYNKLKRTFIAVSAMLDGIKDAIEYCDSIEASLRTSNSSTELFQIEEELAAIGAIKRLKNKPAKSAAKAVPHTYEYDGYVIMAGKNNVQNDKLTFKTANGGDLWLHALKHHGSHVIVFSEARAIPDNVIQFACEIAAFYSTSNTDCEVDYTYRRNVRRSPSGNPGMVTYTNQSTALVKPQQHTEYLVKM